MIKNLNMEMLRNCKILSNSREVVGIDSVGNRGPKQISKFDKLYFISLLAS
jgi:hypothetical protein